MGKVRLELERAHRLAGKIVATLRSSCERIEIAGSIRRRKPMVGDIEIVAIPTYARDLAGGVGDSYLDMHLEQLIAEGRLVPGAKNGPRFKQFGVPGVEGLVLDLFLPTRETWGVVFALRTGSAEYSRRLVTPRWKGGLLPDDCQVRDARVWRRGAVLETREERDFLELCGGWVEPADRVSE